MSDNHIDQLWTDQAVVTLREMAKARRVSKRTVVLDIERKIHSPTVAISIRHLGWSADVARADLQAIPERIAAFKAGTLQPIRRRGRVKAAA